MTTDVMSPPPTKLSRSYSERAEGVDMATAQAHHTHVRHSHLETAASQPESSADDASKIGAEVFRRRRFFLAPVDYSPVLIKEHMRVEGLLYHRSVSVQSPATVPHTP